MPASSQARGSSRRSVLAQAARCVADILAGQFSLAACYARWATDNSESRALLRALVTDCLRWHHRLQWQLDQLLDRPMPPKDAELAALIRLGLLQLQFMRIPAHAAVDETVAATRTLRRHHARSLVNAVLRRFQRDREEIERNMAAVDCARFSHPQWFIEALRRDWPEQAEDVLMANNVAAPLWLRINLARTSVAAYTRKLTNAGIDFELDQELPAAIRLNEAMSVARLPGFAEGEASPQDRSAQAAVGLLELRAGMRVLDACAAPGGKTAAMLEQCPDLSQVVAVDRSEPRLATLSEGLDRLGVTATVICADAGAVDQWWDGRAFDRVLLDAPCSASGVIRRHPDIKLRRTPDDVESAQQMQQALLSALWPVLAEDGRLVYVTCSVLRCENDVQIRQFLDSRPDAQLCEERQYLPGEADGDGFYYACVKKRG